MQLRVGTSGFSYPAWRGSFYPEKLPAGRMLGFYAAHLPAVEINNTFYRMPRAELLAGWAGQVPETFRFVLKASRRITHMKRLRDAGDPLRHLVAATGALGERLGALLFQLPPNLEKDRERLAAFLAELPPGARAAFEFRHPSWYEADVLDLLRDAGVALCVADAGEEGDAPWVATAPLGYLRLRRPEYTDADLAAWVERVRGQAFEQAFVFFKHEEAGAGPALAARFRALLEARAPSRAAAPRRREAAS